MTTTRDICAQPDKVVKEWIVRMKRVQREAAILGNKQDYCAARQIKGILNRELRAREILREFLDDDEIDLPVSSQG